MGDEKPENESHPEFPELQKAVYNFAENLVALRDFVTLTSTLLVEREERLVRKHRRDLLVLAFAVNAALKGKPIPDQEILELKKEVGDIKITVTGQRKVQVDLKHEFQRGSAKVLKDLINRQKHNKLLYRSALISLVSSAEWFLSQMIRQYFESHPDILGNKGTLSLQDLKTFTTIDDAVQHLIGQRIDEIMFGSLEDWIKFLREHLKLSAGYFDSHKDKLIEIFQRRNLMVHNNGLVHPSYIVKVQPQLRKDISIGKEVPVTKQYLEEAIDLVEQIFILFAAEFWKRLSPSDSNRGSTLTYIAFERLQQDRWAVAEALSLFLAMDKQLPERAQMIGLLNYWQSLKWQGRFSEVFAKVKAVDFSAKDELYQLARYALLDDVIKFNALLPQVIKSGKLKSVDVTDWPIFKEMRKTKEFADLVKSRGKELNLTKPAMRTTNTKHGGRTHLEVAFNAPETPSRQKSSSQNQSTRKRTARDATSAPRRRKLSPAKI